MRLSKVTSSVIAALVGLPLVLIACSDDPTADKAASAALQTCKATLAQANGSACFDRTVVCDYPVECADGFFQQVRCPCDGKTFSCSFQGEAVAKGTTPECKNTTGIQPAACPASLAAGEGKACTATGQLCYFAGARCPSGQDQADYCQCMPGADGALVYRCLKRACPTGSPVTPPPADAGGG